MIIQVAVKWRLTRHTGPWCPFPGYLCATAFKGPQGETRLQANISGSVAWVLFAARECKVQVPKPVANFRVDLFVIRPAQRLFLLGRFPLVLTTRFIIPPSEATPKQKYELTAVAILPLLFGN